MKRSNQGSRSASRFIDDGRSWLSEGRRRRRRFSCGDQTTVSPSCQMQRSNSSSPMSRLSRSSNAILAAARLIQSPSVGSSANNVSDAGTRNSFCRSGLCLLPTCLGKIATSPSGFHCVSSRFGIIGDTDYYRGRRVCGCLQSEPEVGAEGESCRDRSRDRPMAAALLLKHRCRDAPLADLIQPQLEIALANVAQGIELA